MNEKIIAKKKQVIDALDELQKALLEEETDITRDASIKRFEFTVELAWKYMQAYVNAQNIDIYGPNNSIREAAKLGLIQDSEHWLEYVKMRNLTTHIYNEQMAKEFYSKLPEFAELCKKLVG